jgi:hypothetical protein
MSDLPQAVLDGRISSRRQAAGRRQGSSAERVCAAVAVALAIVLSASAERAEISKRDIQALSKSQLIYIATVRKDGNQSKAAPVWFTVSADGNAIVIQTGPK